MVELPGPYAHWMMREIHEQPETLRATLERYVDGESFRDETCDPVRKWLAAAGGGLVIAASGSSRHAGMVAELLIEDASGIAVDVEYASEYGYRDQKRMHQGAVMVVSQSGETADTLLALRRANEAGKATLAVTNVPGSTMDRAATAAFPTMAGRERAIPATKSFSAQLMNMGLLAVLAGETRGEMDGAGVRRSLGDMQALPELIAEQLEAWEEQVREVAGHYGRAASFLFLGRGVHYPIAREGALKLKESAYLHAEGYPSGELKHGPNALVHEGIPLVMVATVDRSDAGSVERYEKVVQLMEGMREQGADILAVGNAGDPVVGRLANHVIEVRETREQLLPLCEVVPMQMLAYFMALQAGVDVDRPRNLVKSVVVE